MATQVQAFVSEFLFLTAPGGGISLQSESSLIPNEIPKLQKLVETLFNRNDREPGFQSGTSDCFLWSKQPKHATSGGPPVTAAQFSYGLTLL